MDSLLDAALSYAARGWAVFPIKPGAKAPPLTKHGFQDASTDEDTIRAWWERWPAANVGIATGEVSGFVVVDVDGEKGKRAWEELLVGRDMLPTLESRTPSGGYHVFYQHPGVKFSNGTSNVADKVDTRGDGGYIVAPPSIADGKPYTWANEERIAPLPGWIVDIVKPAVEYDRGAPVHADMNERTRRRVEAYSAGMLRDRCERLHSRGKGDRNTRLFGAAVDLGRCIAAGGIDQGEVTSQLEAAGVASGLSAAEVHKAIRSGLKRGTAEPLELPDDGREDYDDYDYPPPPDDEDAPPSPRAKLRVVDGGSSEEDAAPRWYKLDDIGNAERFRDEHALRLRHCSDIGGWLVWNGARWQPDALRQVVEMAKATVRRMGRSTDGMDDAYINALMKHQHRSASANSLSSMISLARSAPPLPVRTDDWDRKPWLLSVRNGTVDLQSGELREARQEDLITKCAPVEYDPKAECPRFVEFMREIMLDRWDLIEYLQRAIGYSLTGSTREQCLFFLHGEGSNGKSTLMNTTRNMLGDDYSQSIDPQLLLDRNSFAGGPSPEIARLRGARLVTTSEPNPGKRLDEDFIKRITGGDPLTARFNRQDTFQFTPVLKLWFSANHKPRIIGTDHAIWRRIKLVPFEARFEGKAVDADLEEKLRAEWPGILRWAVEGCVLWQSSGMKEPDEVRLATSEYRSSQDILAPFIDECCTVEGDCDVLVADLYKAYRKWAEDNGEKPQSKKRLGQMLDERGYAKRRATGGKWVRCGIKLKGDTSQDRFGYGGESP